VDLLIPTCEEVFYLSKGRPNLKRASKCTLFFQDISILRVLHDKWLFAELVRTQSGSLQKGVQIPNTTLIDSEKELLRVMEKNVDLVLKPCYSRFATQTIIKPSGIQDKQLQVVLSDVKKGVHWVGQHYVHGKHYCSYSIAHEGRVTAHACYPSEFTPGRVGATMVFESVKHNLIQDWVASFVKVNNLSGQYAFDFIEAKDSVYVLECNPRSSSGIHLFADQPEFTDSILDPTSALLLPINHQPLRQISAAMVVGNYFSTGGPGGGFVKGQFFEELQRWITSTVFFECS